jgi:hypothetical protein
MKARAWAVVVALAGVGCGSAVTTAPACVVAAESATTCATTTLDGGAAPSELVAYSCEGSARPDEAPRYVDGVPQGLVCADTSAAGAFCCTAALTTCAYDPVAACDPSFFGVECRGSNRPEAENPRLACGQGVRRGALIDYCCSGQPRTAACVQSDSVVCSSRLMGWTCQGDSLPRGEQLGANRSRADLYGLLCPVPTPAGNAAYNDYCCFTPAPTPDGASCVQDTKVPGCAPGRFGFACTGADTPDEDYAPMRCPDPPRAGPSAQGYAARLYCCDLAPAP